MIGIDWGTTSFRAWRMAPDGTILDRAGSDRGILAIPPGGFPEALRGAIAPWLAAGERLVLLCGMVGSRQGWQEAPYLTCPAGPAEIAATLTPLDFDGARCLLVPGLSTRDSSNVPDVMRGEETKLIGMLAEVGDAPAVACLPGTHAKWARLGDRQVQGFTTHMTGEVRAVLLEHSILGRLAAPGPFDEAAFLRGVGRARDGAGLLHHLFGTRALGLMGELAPEATDSYLSGLLIGHEVHSAMAGGAAAGPIHLAGSAALTRAYALTFDAFGLEHRLHDPDIALRGLALIAETLA
jgi:2-dehydro-3-deoxygalactonokinase